jgi:hypothetical protein
MSRSEDYLKMCEGFKLGKLGAGKRKFADKPETSHTVPINAKSSKKITWEFEKIADVMYEWAEPYDDLEIALIFKIKMSKTTFLRVAIFPEYDDGFFPALSVIVEKNKKKVAELHFKPKISLEHQFRAETEEWIEQHKDDCERDGLKSLEFPKAWMKYQR